MNTGIVKLSPELLALVGTGNANSLIPFSREIFLLDIVVAGTTHCKKIHEVESESPCLQFCKLPDQVQTEACKQQPAAEKREPYPEACRGT